MSWWIGAWLGLELLVLTKATLRRGKSSLLWIELREEAWICASGMRLLLELLLLLLRRRCRRDLLLDGLNLWLWCCDRGLKRG